MDTTSFVRHTHTRIRDVHPSRASIDLHRSDLHRIRDIAEIDNDKTRGTGRNECVITKGGYIIGPSLDRDPTDLSRLYRILDIDHPETVIPVGDERSAIGHGDTRRESWGVPPADLDRVARLTHINHHQTIVARYQVGIPVHNDSRANATIELASSGSSSTRFARGRDDPSCRWGTEDDRGRHNPHHLQGSACC